MAATPDTQTTERARPQNQPTRCDANPKLQSSAKNQGAIHGPDSMRVTSPELDAIRMLGRLLDDLERLRIANGNRIGALERERGDAFPHLRVAQEYLEKAEHAAELELKRAWRRHPLHAWSREPQQKGAGEVLMARLIACIGDPAERPNPAKLWAYCGHGDPARAGAVPKGAIQEELFKRGNPEAKKRVYLLAAQFRRTPGCYYRGIYDDARAKYADRVHAKDCKRCGPSGHPAKAGSPWSLAHQDAAALRLVGKTFLKDLWCAAQLASGTHVTNGGAP